MPECSEELGASLYRRDGAGSAVVDKNDGESPFCSCRASWRRRARPDEHVDELGLFTGGSRRARVVWAAPSTAEPAADAGVPPREP